MELKRAIHLTCDNDPETNTRQSAIDHLGAMLRAHTETMGIAFGWVDEFNQVHLVCTKVQGLDGLSDDDLPHGQELIWIPDRTVGAQAA